jgi:ribonuclease HI
MSKYIVYTDGSCRQGNPNQANLGAGGWSAIVIDPQGHESEYSGCQVSTTNIRMELIAVGRAVREIPDGSEVEIHHDYEGIGSWLTRKWKRKDPNVIKFCSIIETYIKEHNLTITYIHVKGHSGDHYNERADKLADKACKEGIVKRGTN